MRIWLLIVCFVVVTLMGCEKRSSQSRRHALYGPVCETTGTDYALMHRVPRQTVFNFFRRPKLPPHDAHFLQIGSEKLLWSPTDDVKKTGALYFCATDGLTDVWEFALSKRQKLEEISSEDLIGRFYGRNNSDWRNALSAVSDRCFRVVQGQVLLARHRGIAGTVFALELTQQDRGVLTLNYLSITNASGPTSGSSQ